MHFTSLAFLAFLPTVLLAYRLLRDVRSQNLLLLVASYTFYSWWDYRFCGLMLISSLVDYWVGNRLENTDRTGMRRGWLALSITCNLGLLGVFKYCNFFVDGFRQLGELIGFNMSTGTLEIILPVGISFYTFQTMSYTIDIYRRELKPAASLLNYLAFVSFFPQLVAGPIERARNLLPQLQQPRNYDREETFRGVRQIVCGFFKKIVIADTAAVIVTQAYGSPEEASGARLTLATGLFAIQIYCDFSAYSDIAIGTARLFGIRLMQNFAYPYFSQSVGEFWQRWHISLSTWFRDYVYIPLGGNRGGRWKQVRNLMITFLVSGLWHGAAWRFLGWGAFHGAALATEKTAARGSRVPPHDQSLLPTPARMVRMLLTFSLVAIAWVLFRAESLGDAILIWSKMFQSLVDPAEWTAQWIEYQAGGPLFMVLNLIAGFLVLEWFLRNRPFPLDIGDWPMPLRWPVYTLALWLIAEYANKMPSSPFIYFQF